MTTETHTYPDGSQRVGCPPFPELSPKEETEALARGEIAQTLEPEPESQPPEPPRKPKRQGSN